MEENDDLTEEIWSEYFRIKNTLMDNDQNFHNALGTAHMLIKQGKNPRSPTVMTQLFQCQREAGKILHLGIKSCAFKKVPDKERERIKMISRGDWKTITDFEWCEERFDQWFEDSRFFDINIKKERMKAPHEY
jgi:hypothetical protein